LVRISWVGLVYLAVGFVVAATNDYFDNLETVSRIISAALAVLFWPLILIGFDIRVTR
jgi:hypothetical protein